MNSDYLLQMNDGELKKLILNLRSRIKEIENFEDKKSVEECKNLQTHYCYVYRALEYKGII
jgi:hypothetical protein